MPYTAPQVRSKLLFPDAPEEFVYSGTVCWRGRLPLSAIGRGRDWFYKVSGTQGLPACGPQAICMPTGHVEAAYGAVEPCIGINCAAERKARTSRPPACPQGAVAHAAQGSQLPLEPSPAPAPAFLPLSRCLCPPVLVSPPAHAAQAVNNDTWGEYWGSGIRFGWFTVGSEVEHTPAQQQ